MAVIADVHAALERGRSDDAIAIAIELAGSGASRDALAAYFAIGEARPAERARCAAAMGDLHVGLGELEHALERYMQAGSCGAPAEWVSARIEWLNERRFANDVYIERGARELGLTNQRGAVVLRPGKLAFVPSEAPRHLLALAGKAALAGVGVLAVNLRRPMKPEVLVKWLSSIDLPSLDAHLDAIAAERGGAIFTPGDSSFRLDELPLGIRISFMRPKDRVMVLQAKKARAHPVFQRLAARWPVLPGAFF
jgi:hypothetical protein